VEVLGADKMFFGLEGNVNESALEPRERVSRGPCNSSVQLWQRYVAYRGRRAAEEAEREHGPGSGGSNVNKSAVKARVKEVTAEAYETAVCNAGFVANALPLWMDFIKFVKGWDKNDPMRISKVSRASEGRW